jgi:hypothetical protein
MDLAQKTLFRPSDCQTDNKFVIPNTFSVCLEKNLIETNPGEFYEKTGASEKDNRRKQKGSRQVLKTPPIMPYCTTSKHVAA